MLRRIGGSCEKGASGERKIYSLAGCHRDGERTTCGRINVGVSFFHGAENFFGNLSGISEHCNNYPLGEFSLNICYIRRKKWYSL